MAKTKSTPKKKIMESTWTKMRDAYIRLDPMAADPGLGGECTCVILRTLARRFGVPLAEADTRATIEHWELQRQARTARAWMDDFAQGAKNEEEFTKAWTEHGYSHLVAAGPEGAALAAAMARETWRRAAGPALEWEARQEEERAREVYDALEAIRRRYGSSMNAAA